MRRAMDEVYATGRRPAVPMPVSTWVEVNLDRFAANLRAIRAHIGPGREILLVAKADSYGHGAADMAAAAEREGVTQLGVATLHEGMQLRRSGSRLPIMAMSPLLSGEIPEAVRHGIDPSVCDLSFARALSDEAVQAERAVRFHVEVDTGMGRTGVHLDEAEAFLAEACALPGLRLASVYTHFPDADAADPSFAREQVRRFRELLDRLEARGLRPPRAHAANSAGTVNLPEALFDWVRVGLIAYGLQPGPGPAGPGAGRLPLAPVMSFRSRLVQVRDMPAGSTVSYARKFRAPRAFRMGVVPVGYGHGYSWLLSGRGHMLVGGRRVPILGRVTMDLTMVDLSDVADARVGDEVVLFGEQGGASLPVEEVAAGSETLAYEILCTIGKRVTRLYVRRDHPVRVSTLIGERADWSAPVTDYLRRRDVVAAGAPDGGA
jgi:alanine racemase